MKTFRPFIAIALMAFVLSSCGLFPPVRTGSVSVQLGFPSDAPAQEKGFIIAAADAIGLDLAEAKAFDPATTRIVLMVSTDTQQSITVEGDYDRESGPVYMKAEGVPIGQRSVTLQAFDATGTFLTYGQASVFVAAGKSNVVVVNMVPFEPPEIWPGDGATGTINAGMRYFFFFPVETPITYNIELNMGGALSNLFTLYDSTGAKIHLPAASLDVESPTYGQTPELMTGIYYLSVTSPYPHVDGGPEIGYSINLFDPTYNP